MRSDVEQGEGASVLGDWRSRSPRRGEGSLSRRSRATPRGRRDSSESYATSESDGSGSPLRALVVPGFVAGNRAYPYRTVVGSNAASASGMLVGSVVGGVSVPVDPVNSPLTASELVLKVIPAINALKAQLVGLTASLPVMEAAIGELKAGQQDSARKLEELSRKVTEMRASVKFINDWIIAFEFVQLPRGVVGSNGPLYSLSAGSQSAGGVAATAAIQQALVVPPVTTLLPELLASEIDSLFE